MEKTIEILCLNNGQRVSLPIGCSLADVMEAAGVSLSMGAACALVNNRVEGLDYVLLSNSDVRFLDISSPAGMRTYTNSLFFVLCKAAAELFPDVRVRIDTPVSNGYYCRIIKPTEISSDEASALRARMQGIVDAGMPFRRIKAHTDEVAKRFREAGMESKAKLIESTGALYSYYYMLGDTLDYYYGALLQSTAQIRLFGLEKYHDGVLLRLPDPKNPGQLKPLVKQEKMFGVFQENHRLQGIMGLNTIGDFNEIAAAGHVNEIINVAEALQEKTISNIAEEIAARPGIKVVLISGPSSSGKTTFSKRLSVQLMACGIRPYPISMDDYFVDRDKTPLTPSGDYDFESVHALDIPMLSEQLNDLIAGREVELPRYNFHTGKSEKSGKRLRLDPHMILVMEGIHALNPELTAQVAEASKFRIYVSALTSILLDDHNYIPTTDNRLLRRIVRDYQYRGYSARDTISRWPSVRAGEEKWIFPYQENADVMFNSAMVYEIAALKPRVLPLLQQVDERYEEHSEAHRLEKFLSYVEPIGIDTLPPTSLMREFLGGSSFHY